MAYNKNILIQKIQAMSDLSNEEKSALLELLHTHKKYGLVWEDKPEAVEERLRSELPVLVEVKEKAIISDSPTAPNHILIEGDNLEALVTLSYTHAGKIDVIYIDPPYNTGNNDFIYNDNYVGIEDSFRHSKWISFLHKRLTLSKRLLSESGVIFISIDDNEQAQLKLLCDEVFGEDNFIGNIVWLRKKKGSNLSKEFRKVTEYVLCYKNTGTSVELFGEKAYAEKLVPLLNRPNNVSTAHFKANTTFAGKDLSDGVLPAGEYGTGELTVVLSNPIRISSGVVIDDYSLTGRFRWSQSTIDDEISHGSKFYLSKSLRINVSRYNQSDKFKAPSSLIGVDDGIGTNEDATQELREIFSELSKLPFDYPKPTSLIKYLLQSASANRKDCTILDFFAGSGTTLHSTMLLNDSDEGHRKCIIVTSNENNICESVTYERNRRVILGHSGSSSGLFDGGLSNNNLRYYKTSFVGRERSSRSMRELMAASTDLLCIKNDLYNEVTTLSGRPLNSRVVRFFDNGQKQMLVIYQEEAIPAIVNLISSMDNKNKVLVYVFSPGNYPYEDEFVDVKDKVQLCALPAAIYNAYKKVLPKKKVLRLPESENHEDGDVNINNPEE